MLLALAVTAALGCPPAEEGKKSSEEVRAVSKAGESPETLMKKLEEEVDRLEKESKVVGTKPRLDESNTYTFDLSTAAAEGPEGAKLTIVVFSDFECPFCQRFALTSRQLAKKYPADVRSVFMNFPLHNDCNEALNRPYHAKACIAAEAAMEANAQGKFWEMHDWLFQHQRELTPEGIVEFATSIGLDGAKVKEAIETQKYKEVLMAQARQLLPTGSRGTPTVFINGHKTINVRWDDMNMVTKFMDELLNPAEEKKPTVAPAVSNPGQLPPATVVLQDGTRLEERLQNLVSRLSEIKLQTQQPPRPERPQGPDAKKQYSFKLDQSPALGPATAPATLVVFSDFTCPFCEKLSSVYEELHKKFPDQLRVVWKNVPNPGHKFSAEAHEAAMAAHAQGKFWDMHDAIFKNRDKLSPEYLRELAQGLGLDMDKYDAAVKDHTYRQALIEDVKEANDVNVNATPTLFLNGRLQEDRSKEALEAKIKAVLAQPGSAGKP
jgi:protein-disulfide isomerase